MKNLITLNDYLESTYLTEIVYALLVVFIIMNAVKYLVNDKLKA
jgi:hypothetical protein